LFTYQKSEKQAHGRSEHKKTSWLASEGFKYIVDTIQNTVRLICPCLQNTNMDGIGTLQHC